MTPRGSLVRRVGRVVNRLAGAVRRPAATPPPDVEYRPRDDGRPDPGEVVWAWVPYDEGDGRGKDRPVLVHGRRWTDIGTGAWDARGRPSEVRLDRLLVLDPATVRREGAALDRARFDRVVAEARAVQGW